MPRPLRSYQLTSAIVASSVGAGVLCLASQGLGRTYRLHAKRPGPEQNRIAARSETGAIVWAARGARADAPMVYGPQGVTAIDGPKLVRVDIIGGLEQRAGFHDECGGWSDGHDAVADRLCAAFEEGDVLLVVDSPGGAAAGLAEAVDRVLESKTRHGRRITVIPEYQIGSAAYWWVAAIADSIYATKGSSLGSIGARAEHTDVSAMMAREGLKKTYFADPPDKVALAPEFPLSPVGEARGNRDVKLAADAFRAAVCAGPIGVRNGLTPEILFDLGADMLTGQAAVDAGLADDVATFDEVVAFALKQAESEAKSEAPAAPKNNDSSAARAQKGRHMPNARGGHSAKNGHVAPGTRAEGDGDEETNLARAEDEEGPPSSESPESSEEEPEGRSIPTKCGSCEVENAPEAKFCMGCGMSMSTGAPAPPAAPPPSSAPPGAKARSLPRRVAMDGSVLEIFGLGASASLPAQKAYASDVRQVIDMCARMTGEREPAQILGALLVVEQNAAETLRLRGDLQKVKRDQRSAEQWDLAKRLVACNVPGRKRGNVYVDVIGADGKRQTDARGRPLVRLAPEYAEMRIGTLRGLVEAAERDAPKRNPFEADPNKSREAARTGAGGDTAARVAAMKTSQVALRMFRDPTNNFTLDQIAASLVDNEDRMNGGAA